ncbi:MAG: L-threonylcarbamoyladenylate synthase [Acidimicrobiales bacterium]
MDDRTHVLDAVAVLGRGGLVAVPTETVYGLGADAADADAVARIFAVKGRPTGHPLIVHVAGTEDIARFAQTVPASALRLTEALWPGPLTVVVRRADHVPPLVAGGKPTLAVRSPAHPVAQALLEAFGGGIAAPSANRFGRVSPTTAADVRADLGDDVDLVLDGGPCRVGVESTIVDCTGDQVVVLRPGGVTVEVLEGVLGEPVGRAGGPDSPAVPGSLASHYAPRAEVVLAATVEEAVAVAAAASDRCGLLLPRAVEVPEAVTLLVADEDPAAYARVLYARLREADQLGLDLLVAVPPAEHGLGVAVADRLRRAAHRIVAP